MVELALTFRFRDNRGRASLRLLAAFEERVTEGNFAGGSRRSHNDSRVTTVARQTVGRFEVLCVVDAAGPFPLATPAETFPAATARDWESARIIDPRAFAADGLWHLSFHCYVVRGPDDRVTLVDTGIGPEGSPAGSWAPTPGILPEALAGLGIALDDVDTVVQTHLHEDHVGWAVTEAGEPVFRNARYAVQQAEIAALEISGSSLTEQVVRPLRRVGQLHELDGRVRLVGQSTRLGHEIVAVPTPGHTPGHQSVVIRHDDEHIVITGDVLVHAIQLANPDVGYAFEEDRTTARDTRHALLSDAIANRAILATSHLNQPFLMPHHGSWASVDAVEPRDQ